ncbi:MAG: hypothetical protein KF908_06700 [Nitrosomonas sp.]|nr:hypothetical protein [Nitrosomonas sp.]
MLIQFKLLSVAVVLAAVFNAGAVHAHGKESLEDDSCMRRSGENIVHLSVYQPQVDITGHYCTDIPSVGNTVLVVDLVDPPLREMPIEVKLFKGSGEEGEMLTQIRAAIYEDGVISTQQVLEEGKHLLVITADGMPPLKYFYHLRVEMINYAEVFRATIGPVIGLLLTTLIGYKLLKSRRFKNWIANRGKGRDA